MDSLMLTFGAVKLQWHTVLLSFIFAFSLSSTIAIVYEKTFTGLSWSKGLVQSMILGSLISCLLMIAIGDNVARGIGIVGSLAVIRFRTNLRDPRDLVFLFASLGAGVAAGVQSYVAGSIGTLFFSATAIALHASNFGTRRKHDGLVRFQIPKGPDAGEKVAQIMQKIPKTFALVTMRDVSQGEMVDCAYQVKLPANSNPDVLLQSLNSISGIRGLTYMNQQTTVEV